VGGGSAGERWLLVARSPWLLILLSLLPCACWCPGRAAASLPLEVPGWMLASYLHDCCVSLAWQCRACAGVLCWQGTTASSPAASTDVEATAAGLAARQLTHQALCTTGPAA
jgi:hypothetical protein